MEQTTTMKGEGRVRSGAQRAATMPAERHSAASVFMESKKDSDEHKVCDGEPASQRAASGSGPKCLCSPGL